MTLYSANYTEDEATPALKALLLAVLARGEHCSEFTLTTPLSEVVNHSLHDDDCHPEDEHAHDEHDDEHDEEHSELEESLLACTFCHFCQADTFLTVWEQLSAVFTACLVSSP